MQAGHRGQSCPDVATERASVDNIDESRCPGQEPAARRTQHREEHPPSPDHDARARGPERLDHVASVGKPQPENRPPPNTPSVDAGQIQTVDDLARRPNNDYDAQPDAHGESTAGKRMGGEQDELRVVARLRPARELRRDRDRTGCPRRECEPRRDDCEPRRPPGGHTWAAPLVERVARAQHVDHSGFRARVGDGDDTPRRAGEIDVRRRRDQGDGWPGRPRVDGGDQDEERGGEGEPHRPIRV